MGEIQKVKGTEHIKRTREQTRTQPPTMFTIHSLNPSEQLFARLQLSENKRKAFKDKQASLDELFFKIHRRQQLNKEYTRDPMACPWGVCSGCSGNPQTCSVLCPRRT